LEAELERRTGMTRAQFHEFGHDSAESKAYLAAEDALDEEESIPRRFPQRSDEENARDADRLYGLIDNILSHHALTREGLRLQCRAMIIVSRDSFSDQSWWFVASVVSFLRMETRLPDALVADLYGWDDEEDDEAA
jgi:hypothetical protein